MNFEAQQFNCAATIGAGFRDPMRGFSDSCFCFHFARGLVHSVFSVLELSAVGFAFLVYARHATERETIALVEDYLLVELVRAGIMNRFKLDLRQARINPMRSGASLIILESSDVRVDAGRHLTEWKRHELAQSWNRR